MAHCRSITIGTGSYRQRNCTVARASLPGAASVPGVASFSLEAITTADLPRRRHYALASSTSWAFSSAPLLCPDEPVTQNAPSRAGMTNDLDPHPANAMAARQMAKRKDTICSLFIDVGSPVRAADPEEPPGGVAPSNRQGRKVHRIGPLAIKDAVANTMLVAWAWSKAAVHSCNRAAPLNPEATG